jgi:hypothetical protein
MTSVFTGIVMIIGLFVFIVGDRIHADIKEIGRLVFACALLAFLFGH